MKSRYVSLVGSILMSIAFLLQFVSICDVRWFSIRKKIELENNQRHLQVSEYGLWKARLPEGTKEVGYFIELGIIGMEQVWVDVVRSFSIIGLLVQAVCVVLAVTAFRHEKSRETVIFASFYCSIISVTFLMIEFSVFAGKMAGFKDSPPEGTEVYYQSSFYLCVVSWVLSLAALLTFLVAIRKFRRCGE